MGQRNIKGNRRRARKGATVYGAPDQMSSYVATIKYQCIQVLGVSDGYKRGLLGPIGTTYIPVCQHMRGSIHQVVRVQEESPT
jgi:hypothetical protein